MDRTEYLKIATTQGQVVSTQYKKEHIPRTLYKYYFLYDYTCCSESCSYFKKENEKKIDALRKNIFWLSTREALNDPFELKAYSYNEEKLLKKHPKECIDIIKPYLNDSLIGCFTTNKNNMPMWAHYSNNHKEFVVEYEINKYFYPVCYKNTYLKLDTAIDKLISLTKDQVFHKKILSKEECFDQKLSAYIAFHNNLYKHTDWEYEDEFRIIAPKNVYSQLNSLTKYGALSPNIFLGIIPKAIFLGLNSSAHKEILVSIGKEKSIPIYQMDYKKENNDYMLFSTIIN